MKDQSGAISPQRPASRDQPVGISQERPDRKNQPGGVSQDRADRRDQPGGISQEETTTEEHPKGLSQDNHPGWGSQEEPVKRVLCRGAQATESLGKCPGFGQGSFGLRIAWRHMCVHDASHLIF